MPFTQAEVEQAIFLKSTVCDGVPEDLARTHAKALAAALFSSWHPKPTLSWWQRAVAALRRRL